MPWANKDPRGNAEASSYSKMQAVLRMIVIKVMKENKIDLFVNPEQTTPPYLLGNAPEPEVNGRGSPSCCQGFTALLGGPEADVPAGYRPHHLRSEICVERGQEAVQRRHWNRRVTASSSDADQHDVLVRTRRRFGCH